MTWRQSYVTGSFRSIPFRTKSHTTTFGRRVATYEFPFDDKGVAHQDLGRAARVFQINACLLGDEYHTLRDDFIAALEKRGPGLLVHPQLGRFMVVVKNDIQITESTEFGGKAEISFTCVEARDPVPIAVDPSIGLEDAARLVKESAAANFIETVQENASQPDFVLQGLTDDIDAVLKDLREANSTITTILATPGEITGRIDDISLQLLSLYETPRRMFDAIDGAIQSLVQSAGRIFDLDVQRDLVATLSASYVLRASKRLSRVGQSAKPIPATATPARAAQRRNRAALLSAARASVLANTVLQLADTPPASRDEAEKASDDLANQVLELADGSIEGEDLPQGLYDSVKQLAVATFRFTERVAGTAPRVRRITLGQPLPVQVIAWQLYGDAERADEILGRNPGLPHGGALPAGHEIETLED